jgi:hypothetical protein
MERQEPAVAASLMAVVVTTTTMAMRARPDGAAVAVELGATSSLNWPEAARSTGAAEARAVVVSPPVTPKLLAAPVAIAVAEHLAARAVPGVVVPVEQ